MKFFPGMSNLFFRGRQENGEIITTIRKGDIFFLGSSHEHIQVPVNAMPTDNLFSQPGVLYLEDESNSWGIFMDANEWKRTQFIPSGLVVGLFFSKGLFHTFLIWIPLLTQLFIVFSQCLKARRPPSYPWKNSQTSTAKRKGSEEEANRHIISAAKIARTFNCK